MPEVKPEALPVLMGRVLAELPAIGKDSKAPPNMGNYAFRGIEAILAALKPKMAAHGVFCLPKVLERVETERKLATNKTMYVVDLHIEWMFYGPAGDSLTADAWGQGTDMGDKATQKAATSAFKTMLGQAFCIGDSEADSERHDVPESEGRRTAPATDLKGWPDALSRDREHSLLASRVSALDDESKEWCRKFKAEHGWPMSSEDFALFENAVCDMETALQGVPA